MRKIDIVEALADCIMQFEGWMQPNSENPNGSTSWRNRNPGNLRPFDKNTPQDDRGYRIFSNMANGWLALMQDISVKLNGFSKHKLTPQSTLYDFFNIYAPSTDNNDPSHYTRTIALWLNRIYGIDTIKPETTLYELLKLGKDGKD